jgi:hypothetical protein
VPILPLAVANVITGALTVILKLLLTLCPFDVALIVKLVVVLELTAEYVPVIAPVLGFKEIPEGKLPDSNP